MGNLMKSIKIKFAILIYLAIISSCHKFKSKKKQDLFYESPFVISSKTNPASFFNPRIGLINSPSAYKNSRYEYYMKKNSLRAELVRNFNSISVSNWISHVELQNFHELEDRQFMADIEDIRSTSIKLQSYVITLSNEIFNKMALFDMKLKESSIIQKELKNFDIFGMSLNSTPPFAMRLDYILNNIAPINTEFNIYLHSICDVLKKMNFDMNVIGEPANINYSWALHPQRTQGHLTNSLKNDLSPKRAHMRQPLHATRNHLPYDYRRIQMAKKQQNIGQRIPSQPRVIPNLQARHENNVDQTVHNLQNGVPNKKHNNFNAQLPEIEMPHPEEEYVVNQNKKNKKLAKNSPKELKEENKNIHSNEHINENSEGSEEIKNSKDNELNLLEYDIKDLPGSENEMEEVLQEANEIKHKQRKHKGKKNKKNKESLQLKHPSKKENFKNREYNPNKVQERQKDFPNVISEFNNQLLINKQIKTMHQKNKNTIEEINSKLNSKKERKHKNHSKNKHHLKNIFTKSNNPGDDMLVVAKSKTMDHHVKWKNPSSFSTMIRPKQQYRLNDNEKYNRVQNKHHRNKMVTPEIRKVFKNKKSPYVEDNVEKVEPNDMTHYGEYGRYRKNSKNEIEPEQDNVVKDDRKPAKLVQQEEITATNYR